MYPWIVLGEENTSYLEIVAFSNEAHRRSPATRLCSPYNRVRVRYVYRRIERGGVDMAVSSLRSSPFKGSSPARW